MCNMALSESQANTLVYALFRLICCRNMFCRLKFLTLVSAFMHNLLKYAWLFCYILLWVLNQSEVFNKPLLFRLV